MDGEAPQAIVFVLLLLRRQRREMLIEERVDARSERPKLKVGDRCFQIMPAVLQGVRLLAFHLVDLMVCAERWNDAGHR